MKLKGNWSAETSYNVGEVVVFQGLVYHLQRPCAAGVPPVNTLYWGLTDQITAVAAKLVMDGVEMADAGDLTLEDDLLQTTAGKKALDAHQGYVLKGLIDGLTIPDNIGPSSIVLNSSSEGSTKQFLLTIADPASGEDPELTITEIVPDTPAAEESET